MKCHAEPKIHSGSKLGTDCAKCHTTTTWTGGTLGDFKHNFPITHGGGGGKKAKACVLCHKPAERFRTYTCYECHRHDPAKTVKKHADKGIANVDNCAKCHPLGKKGVKLTATEFAGDDLFASCPADAGHCDTHDVDLCPRADTHTADPLEDWLRWVGRSGARPLSARSMFDHAARAPRPTATPRQPAVVVLTSFNRFDWFAEPFSKLCGRGAVGGTGRLLHASGQRPAAE